MKKILCLFLLVIFIGGDYFYLHRNNSLNEEEILNQSILKDRKFSGQVTEVTATDGKIKAYLMEEHSLPLVAVSFGFSQAGKAYETKEGVGLLIDSVLLDGTEKYSRQNLRDLMKEKGIKLDVSVSADRIDFSLSYIKQFEQEAIDVLKEVLYAPLFADEDMEVARRQLAVVRKQKLEAPYYYLDKLIDKHFYGAHPYGRESVPDEQVLVQVTAADLKDYLKKVMVKDRLALGFAGDINSHETRQFIEDVFANMADSGDNSELPILEANFTDPEKEATVEFSAQDFVHLFAKGIKRSDEDFYPLFIADYILGGSGLSSRINKAVREKEGLTYSINSFFSNHDAVDLWHISFSATPEEAIRALKIVQEEYQRFYQKGVTKEELLWAKESLLSSFNLRFASLFNIAEMLRYMQVENLGIDFLEKRQDMVRAVTLDEVNDAIKRKLPKALDGEGGTRIFHVKGGKK